LIKVAGRLGEPLPFGPALRELRTSRGLSLERLSRLAHYNKGYLSKVENGHRLPSAELARRCDEVLGAAGGLARLLPGAPAVRRGAMVRPAQLPADVAAFTGRDGPMAELDALLAGAGRAAAVAVTVITGTPGIGKTALAVHWAHHVAGQFTDGVLYANLRGHDPDGAPAQPADVLDGFLRALGAAPAVIPPSVDGRSALLRSLVHGKQTLILLDNAATPGQVRPLLPGSPGCVAVVTSRSRMSGLVARDGARRVTIGALTETEVMLLLQRILGPARVDAEPMAAAEIAQRCAGLPLALRIAADRAATHPHLTLADLADQLAAEHDRLDVLTSDGDEAAAVRTVFSWSYTALPADAARMFRVLGLHPGMEISIHAAATLAALRIAPAGRLLDVLAGVHLLEETAPGRYRFHDLVRAYAAERAQADEPPLARGAAIGRLVAWYLHTADAADRVLMPGRRYVPLDAPPPHCHSLRFTSYEQALAWCDAEQPNLVAVAGQAAESGQDDSAWKLAAALWSFFCLRRPLADWITTSRIGLAAARRTGNRRAEARALNGLGTAYFCLRRFEDSLNCFREALGIPGETGDDVWGEGIILNNLGELYWELSRLDDALACHQQALALFLRAGDRRGEGITLDNLGTTYRKLGRPADALTCHQQALVLFREAGDRRGEGMALNNLGETCRELGQPDDAIDHYRQSLNIRRQAGDRQGEAITLQDLGNALCYAGQPEAAQSYRRRALAIFEELGDPQAAQVRAHLGSAAASPI
jgi:tetratricopeptide (TPR) repeat protein/transcriptional regulator with XRE-family HTH domain